MTLNVCNVGCGRLVCARKVVYACVYTLSILMTKSIMFKLIIVARERK